MSNPAIFSNLLYPQLKVIEDESVSRILPLQSFSHIYVFGDSVSGDVNTPTIVNSYKDFINQFGNPSTIADGEAGKEQIVADSIKAIFENDTTANLYFIRVDNDGGYEPGLATYEAAIDALQVEDEYPGGFMIAPGAGSITAVGNKLTAKAEELDFMAFVDPDEDLMSATTKPAVAAIQADADRYDNSSTGHVAYYYPYMVNNEDRLVAPSAIAASVATARIKEQGYKPNAGLRYIIKGVKEPKWQVTNAEQGVLNPEGINVIRKFRGTGNVIWGMRTRQTAVLYRYVHTRVIANVVNNTFRRSMELKLQLFDLIDGQGRLLARIEDAAYSVGRQLYQSGLLFGASEADAFLVKADFENNTADQLQLGYVLIEFEYAVTPAVEKMAVVTRLANIGQVGISNGQGGNAGNGLTL